MVLEKNTYSNTLATFSYALSQTLNMMNDACNTLQYECQYLYNIISIINPCNTILYLHFPISYFLISIAF